MIKPVIKREQEETDKIGDFLGEAFSENEEVFLDKNIEK